MLLTDYRNISDCFVFPRIIKWNMFYMIFKNPCKSGLTSGQVLLFLFSRFTCLKIFAAPYVHLQSLLLLYDFAPFFLSSIDVWANPDVAFFLAQDTNRSNIEGQLLKFKEKSKGDYSQLFVRTWDWVSILNIRK